MKLNKEQFTDGDRLRGFLNNGDKFIFDDTLCSILKELKFNYETEGCYSRKILVCRIEDNIDMIKSHVLNENDTELYFYMCHPAIVFITRLIEIPQSFIEKYDVKPWHESLIKRTYFDLNINTKAYSYTDSESEIYLGDKRPYGNSYVPGDIAEEHFTFNKNKKLSYNGETFKWFDDLDYHHAWIDDNSDFLFDIMDETNDIIKKLLKEVDYNDYIFNKKQVGYKYYHYIDAWEIDNTLRYRNSKIDKLVENE